MLTRIANLPKTHSFFLFGPRQTGKSTLVHDSFRSETTLTYNLLLSKEYIRLAANPSLLQEEVSGRAPKITHVFIDEVQRIPALLNEVHALMESNVPLHFILTGSSARKLKRDQANLLAGRALTFKLFPLTHKELGSGFDLKRALEVGTLPKIYLEKQRDTANDMLRSYVETYLKEEIEAEALVRSTGPFLRFLFQAARENGNLLNYSTIARETGTKRTAVKEYFSILEDTLIGHFLFPFHSSHRKRLAQHPKFYFFDSGIVRALTKKLTLELEPGTIEFGDCFETWIINETIRLSTYWKKDFEFSFFRTERGAEVDLVIETPRKRTIAVEIKSSENPTYSDVRAGFAAIREVERTIEPLCVCRAERPRAVEGVQFLPWKSYFEFLENLN